MIDRQQQQHTCLITIERIRRVVVVVVCRPSTPIGEVLQGRFLDDWLQSMQNKRASADKGRVEAAVRRFH
jgi:hypothetical protein